MIFLFLYIFFLGESNIYRFFRKIGIYIYIFFTIIAQLLLAIQYFKLRNTANKFLNKKFIKYKLIFSVFLISFSIIVLPILLIKIEHFPEIKNIISWNYFLVHSAVLFDYFLLLETHFSSGFTHQRIDLARRCMRYRQAMTTSQF